METCANHPDRKALSVCHNCGRPFCESCLVEGREYYYCKTPACQVAMKEESPGNILGPKMNCPNCSAELELSDEDRRSGKFRCPSCEAFVDFTINPPMILGKKDYVEVFSSRNQGDIALLKSYLDDSDIDYYVRGEDFLATYPLIQPAIFFVLADQAEEAKELIGKFNTNIFGVSRRKESPE